VDCRDNHKLFEILGKHSVHRVMNARTTVAAHEAVVAVDRSVDSARAEMPPNYPSPAMDLRPFCFAAGALGRRRASRTF